MTAADTALLQLLAERMRENWALVDQVAAVIQDQIRRFGAAQDLLRRQRDELRARAEAAAAAELRKMAERQFQNFQAGETDRRQ